MKRITSILFFLIISLSCSNNQQKLLPSSSGNINNVSVVSSDELWDGAVGDIIRENFGRPIYGLPQMSQFFPLAIFQVKCFQDLLQNQGQS